MPFSYYSGVTVHVRDRAWAESMGMGSFLSVAKGSEEPPAFVEVYYHYPASIFLLLCDNFVFHLTIDRCTTTMHPTQNLLCLWARVSPSTVVAFPSSLLRTWTSKRFLEVNIISLQAH